MCHQNQPLRLGNCRDHQVIRTNRCPQSRGMGTDDSVFFGSRIVERLRNKLLAKSLDPQSIVRLVFRCSSFGPKNQLSHDDRADYQIQWFLSCDSGHQFWLAHSEPTNAGVGVQQVLHESGSRSSYSPWGGRSKSPCQLPAISSTQAFHSAGVWIGGWCAEHDSTVTCTSSPASTKPTGSERCSTPSLPTFDLTTMRFISLASK